MKRVLLSLCFMAGFMASHTVVIAQVDQCINFRYSQDPLFDLNNGDILILQDQLFATSVRWPGNEVDDLHMDLYMPHPSADALPARAALVLTHGGGYIPGVGGPSDMEALAMEFALRGFVVAIIEIRLGWDCNVSSLSSEPCLNCTPEAWKLKVAAYRAVQDNRAALRYLVDNAGIYKIDLDNIFLAGEGTGAITSLYSAFWDQSEADLACPDCVTEIGLLDTAGNDLTGTFQIKGVINNCGGINTLSIMDGHNIPVASFHDEDDCTIPYNAGAALNCGVPCNNFMPLLGSFQIKERLDLAGVCNHLNTIQNSSDHCSYPLSQFVKKSSCFMKDIMCDDCTSNASLQINDFPDCTAGTLITSIEEAETETWLDDNVLRFKTSTEVSSIQVYDMAMRKVADVPVNKAINSFALPSVKTGNYLIWIQHQGGDVSTVKWSNF